LHCKAYLTDFPVGYRDTYQEPALKLSAFSAPSPFYYVCIVYYDILAPLAHLGLLSAYRRVEPGRKPSRRLLGRVY
jgi:hypothetical protein